MDKTPEVDSSKPNVITFSAGMIRLDPDTGIVWIDFHPSTHITLDLAREEITALKRLTGGRRRLVMCDFRNVASTDLAARTYYGGRETSSAYLACAFITPSPLTRAIGNVFLAFHGRISASRVRLFRGEREALEWLRTHA